MSASFHRFVTHPALAAAAAVVAGLLEWIALRRASRRPVIRSSPRTGSPG